SRHHSYGRVRTSNNCIPGFGVFKGPVFSIAATIGYAEGSLVAGYFTPAAGCDLMLLIDVRKAYSPHAAATWRRRRPEEPSGFRVGWRSCSGRAWICVTVTRKAKSPGTP